MSRCEEKMDAPNFVGFISKFPKSILTIYLSPPAYSIDKRSPYLISLRRESIKAKCYQFIYDCPPGCRRNEKKFTKGIKINCIYPDIFMYENSDINKITINITDPTFVAPNEEYKLNAQIHNGRRWGNLLTAKFLSSHYKPGPPMYLKLEYNFDFFNWTIFLNPPSISNGKISQYRATVTRSDSNECILLIYDCPSCRINGSLGTNGPSLKTCKNPQITNKYSSPDLEYILFRSSDRSIFQPGKAYSLEVQAVNGWGKGDILTKNITLHHYKSSSPELSNITYRYLDNKLETNILPPAVPNGQISRYIVVIKTLYHDADGKCVKILLIKCTDCLIENVGTNGEPSIIDENECFNVTITEFEFQTLSTNINIFDVDEEYLKYTKYKIQVQAGNAWGWGEPSIFYKLTIIQLYRKNSIILFSIAFIVLCVILLNFLLWIRRYNKNVVKTMKPMMLEKYNPVLFSMPLYKINSKMVPIIQFENYFKYVSKHNYEALICEFKKLSEETKSMIKDLRLTMNAGKSNVNIKKNRYRNIVPYDHSRVLIPTKCFPQNYINASFIPFLQENGIEYIACQGPIEKTINDFWQMIWEQNVALVVMLTRTYENGDFKCLSYWPDAVDSVVYFGNTKEIQVTLVSEIANSNHIERELKLFNSKAKQSRTLVQLQMITWIDFSAPSLENFSSFLFRYHQISTTLNCRPYIIHCSAGVGRTGTMISIDRIIKQLVNGSQEIDIYKTVLNLRSHRCNMVQRPAQYIFIHEYINHFLNVYMTNNENNDHIYFNE